MKNSAPFFHDTNDWKRESKVGRGDRPPPHAPGIEWPESVICIETRNNGAVGQERDSEARIKKPSRVRGGVRMETRSRSLVKPYSSPVSHTVGVRGRSLCVLKCSYLHPNYKITLEAVVIKIKLLIGVELHKFQWMSHAQNSLVGRIMKNPWPETCLHTEAPRWNSSRPQTHTENERRL